MTRAGAKRKAFRPKEVAQNRPSLSTLSIAAAPAIPSLNLVLSSTGALPLLLIFEAQTLAGGSNKTVNEPVKEREGFGRTASIA